MLLTLLIYAYACCQRSSRKIEQLCTTDVAFRVICAQDAPDHTVISRFRKLHLEAFEGLFAQMLGLCRDAGMAQLGTVAINGSKIAANASRLANRGAEWLDAEIARTEADIAGQDTAGQDGQAAAGRAADRETVAAILVEAARVDAAEDAEYGPDARGDELPAGWRRRAERLERLRAARARLQAIEDAERAERAEAERLTREHAEQAARARSPPTARHSCPRVPARTLLHPGHC